MKRDLHADLALCASATPGPWSADDEEWPGNDNLQYWVDTHYDGILACISEEDARFIADAREGWPHAIERALVAEAEIAAIRADLLQSSRTLYEAQRYIDELEDALREVDTHIRSTGRPVPYIVDTLKRVLPEYK